MNDMINNDRIARLEQKAIDFIRNAEPLALRMDERGFHVAFSGGKDSQVLLRLVEMAGVKHHAEMQVTTVDSSNLMRFVREHYPQVKMNRPQMNMRQLIAKKGMLPTRQSRYCCAYLKEQAGAGTVTCLGIRKEESQKRAKRHDVEIIGQDGGYKIVDSKLYESAPDESFFGAQLFDTDTETKVYCVGGKDKVLISPIFEWTTKDVWDFIHIHEMPYCDLYDKGFHRIGCLFCPMASPKEKQREMELFPKFAERVYIRAIRDLMERGKYDNFDSPEQVFQWWLSGENAQEWLAIQNQPSLFDTDTK